MESHTLHSRRTKHRAYGALAAVAAVALSGLLAAFAVADSNPKRTAAKKGGGKSVVFKFTTNDTADLDLGAPGPSMGDDFVFSETLFRKGRKIGVTGGNCMTVGLEPPFEELTYQCMATLRMRNGQITLQGLLDATGPADPGPFTLAITGGTGDYTGASGRAILTLTDYTLHFAGRR
jgi:hypothetical protein